MKQSAPTDDLMCVPTSNNDDSTKNISTASNSNKKVTTDTPAIANQTSTASVATTTLNTTTQIDEDANVSKPSYISLVEGNPPPSTVKPIIDVGSPNFTPRKTIFKVMMKDHRGRSKPVDLTPSVLMSKYYSKELITHLMNASNAYRKKTTGGRA